MTVASGQPRSQGMRGRSSGGRRLAWSQAHRLLV